jgi:hypothetical protein
MILIAAASPTVAAVPERNNHLLALGDFAVTEILFPSFHRQMPCLAHNNQDESDDKSI